MASALLGGGLDEGSGLTTRPSGPVSSAGAHLEWSVGAPDAWACLARGGLRLLIMRGLGCSSPGPAGLGARAGPRPPLSPSRHSALLTDRIGDLGPVCLFQGWATTRSRFTSWISEWPVPRQAGEPEGGCRQGTVSLCQTRGGKGPWPQATAGQEESWGALTLGPGQGLSQQES